MKESIKSERYTFRLDQMDELKLRALLMVKVPVPAILRQAIRDAWTKRKGGE